MRIRFSSGNGGSKKPPSLYGLLGALLLIVVAVQTVISAFREGDDILLWALSLFCFAVGSMELVYNCKGLLKQRKRKKAFDDGYGLDYNRQTGCYDSREKSLFCPYCGKKVEDELNSAIAAAGDFLNRISEAVWSAGHTVFLANEKL